MQNFILFTYLCMTIGLGPPAGIATERSRPVDAAPQLRGSSDNNARSAKPKHGTDGERVSQKGSKKKRKRRRRSRTSSDTSDSLSTSNSTASVSDLGSSSSDSSIVDTEKKKAGTSIWEKLKDIWCMESRPSHMRHRSGIQGMSLSEIMKYKEHYELESQKRGVGAAIFGRDQRVKPRRYKSQRDDGVARLHPARWERLPMAEPKKYWRRVPKKRDEIFRHLHLAHYGADGLINEATLVKLHDRQVPVELSMLHGANFTRAKSQGQDSSAWAEPTEVRQLQEAVLNYATVMHILWPFDFGPLVIMRVLIECRWGEAAGSDEKARIMIVSRFFNEIVKENSGRAVRGEPPADFEKARAKYSRIVMSTFPTLGHMSTASTGGNNAVINSANANNRNQGGARKGGRPFIPGGGGGGNGGANGGLNAPKAVHNGRPVCFNLNQASGCGRRQGAADACLGPKGALFAHYCNFYDRAAGCFCLAQHPRVQFH